MEHVTPLVAFGAGVISFFSPCILPLIPAYLSFVTGVSLDRLSGAAGSGPALRGVVISCLLFVAGFSAIFVGLGASATAVGQFLGSRISVLEKLAGVVVILFGLHTAGLLRIRFLDYERRFHPQAGPVGWLSPFIVGLAFGFGWTPCVGPILGAILAWAAVQQTVGQGVTLLSAYSLGLGFPFLLAGLGFNAFLRMLARIKGRLRAVEVVGGAVLVLVGILIFTGYLSVLSASLAR